MQIPITDIKRFQTGDLEAFQRLMQFEGCRLLSFIHSQLHLKEAAEDLYQEIWFSVWHNRQQLREAQAFPAWLYRIARRTIQREFRRQAWEREMRLFPDEEHWPENADQGLSQREQLERKELIAAIHEAFDLLDEQTQAVMVLRYKSSLKLAEISEATNLPLGTVYSKMRQGLVRVGRFLTSRGFVEKSTVEE